MSPRRKKQTPCDDAALCGAMIERLGRLLDEALARAGADPAKDTVAQCINLAQQIGAWVDRRAKLAPATPPNEAADAEPNGAELDLDALEARFHQALDDIRHVRQSS